MNNNYMTQKECTAMRGLYFVAAMGLSWAVKQLIDRLPHPKL